LFSPALRRAGDQLFAGLAELASGRWLITWNGPGGEDRAVYQRRLCEPGEGCDACPGFDDTDSDGDGLADGCDPCTNAGGARDFVGKRKLLLSGRGDPAAADHKLRIKGSFELPAAATLADLDPAGLGLRLRVETTSGLLVVDEELKAGAYAGRGSAGWSTNKTGSRVKYRDRSDSPVNGRFKVVLKQVPGAVKVVVGGGDAPFPFDPVDPVELLQVATPVPSGAAAGMCAAAEFAPGECRVSANGFKLRCR
jgi:hypothetical protein